MKKRSAYVTGLVIAGLTLNAQAATIAHWELDSDATDGVGGYNGTVEGTVTFGVDGARHYSNEAADFTGSNPSNIDVPFTPALNPAGDWTVTAWVKPDNIGGGFRSIITSRNDVGGGALTEGYILYQNGSSLQFWSGDGVGGGWESIVHSNVLVPDQWVHVALAYDADGGGGTGRKTFFVNAQPVGFQNVNIAPNTAEAFHIGSGADDGNSFFFNGQIDDVYVFDEWLGTSRLIRLTAIPLPEPSTAFTVIMGACILGFYRRVRHETAARKYAQSVER